MQEHGGLDAWVIGDIYSVCIKRCKGRIGEGWIFIIDKISISINTGIVDYYKVERGNQLTLDFICRFGVSENTHSGDKFPVTRNFRFTYQTNSSLLNSPVEREKLE